MPVVLKCKQIYKTYRQGPQRLNILNGLEFEICAGQHVAIVGASGSGKSTLLNVLGGLDRPDSGTVSIHGKPFSTQSENERGRVRNQHLGFVYQFHHLLGEFSALENVALPLLIAGQKKRVAFAGAQLLLEKVGLATRASHRPPQLSGGERQRVAIARALVNSPSCVLMDEPTGNLDGENARAVQNLMKELSANLDTAFVVVTHDHQFAHTMNAVWELADGQLRTLEETS